MSYDCIGTKNILAMLGNDCMVGVWIRRRSPRTAGVMIFDDSPEFWLVGKVYQKSTTPLRAIVVEQR